MPLLHGAIGQFGGVAQGALSTLPFLVTFFTLWLMYATIPNCPVRRRDAAIGALLGAVLFEVARRGFTLYVQHAQTYQQIYGVLAANPIFLLWIYLSWVIVILGASIGASISAFEYHPPAQTLPAGAEFLGLLVVLRQFVEAQRAGTSVDPAGVRALAPYLRTASIATYFNDLQRADLIQRGESGGWLLTRSLDSTDLLRVYRHTDYRLPLHPQEEAAALGVDLPPALLALLDELAVALESKLGARLAHIYPPAAPAPTETTS
jgi:membrane protein